MSLWEIVVSIVVGRRERWDPEQDATVHYLRTQRGQALVEARRLRHLGIPLTGNIIEDNATGAASRYRQQRRTGEPQHDGV